MLSLSRRGWFCFLLVAGLAVAGGYAWVERATLHAWYGIRQLAKACPQDREAILEGLSPHGQSLMRPLINQIRSGDERTVENCGWALVEICRNPELDPDQAAAILCEAAAGLRGAGRRQVFLALEALIQSQKAWEIPDATGRLIAGTLTSAARTIDAEQQALVYGLAALLQYRVGWRSSTGQETWRSLATAGLKDARSQCRAAAVRLAAAPGVDLLHLLPPLVLGARPDPSAEVRALALLAIGGNDTLVATDDLLPLLHDPDQEVRAVCERALRSRGLQTGQLQLARAMTDPQPGVRARVPTLIQEFPDLDVRMWLERLSRDPSPAVRAAVIRSTMENGEVALQDRIREMAAQDPSPTVRQIAEYYRTRHEANRIP